MVNLFLAVVWLGFAGLIFAWPLLHPGAQSGDVVPGSGKRPRGAKRKSGENTR